MGFKNYRNIMIVAGLAVAVAVAVSVKRGNSASHGKDVSKTEAEGTVGESAVQEKAAKLPKLVDLGADKCIPCKMMAPILDELGKEFQDRFGVEFIDVWKNPDAGKKYGVNIIPTQIFYDASGKELFRHEGFFPKADILRKWKEFGTAIKDEEIKNADERQ